MVGLIFDANFLMQLAFLIEVCFNFQFIGYTAQEFLVFILTWILSDLAVLAYLCTLAIATPGKVFTKKLEKILSFPVRSQ